MTETAWRAAPAPRDKGRILIRTDENIYAGEPVQNYITGHKAFMVADLGDGGRALIPDEIITAWMEIPA